MPLQGTNAPAVGQHARSQTMAVCVGESAHGINGASLPCEIAHTLFKGIAAHHGERESVEVVAEPSHPAAIMKAFDAAIDFAVVHGVEEFVRMHGVEHIRTVVRKLMPRCRGAA